MADAKRQTNPDLVAALDTVETYGDGCKVLKIMRQMTEEEAKSLQEAIDNPLVSMTAVRKILFDHGFEVSERSLSRHRNRNQGACGCSV